MDEGSEEEGELEEVEEEGEDVREEEVGSGKEAVEEEGSCWLGSAKLSRCPDEDNKKMTR